MTHKLDEFIEHAGVKGMKWGVRKQPKKTLRVEVSADSKWTPDRSAQIANNFNGTALALPVGLAIGVRSGIKRSKMKKRIAEGLNSRPSDFKRKDMRNAVSTALEFKGIKIKSSDGNSIKMATKLDDVIRHAGVKGMKWGVRRNREQLAKSRGGSKSIESIKDKVKSQKRERSWSKVDTKNLSSQELNKIAQRVQLENDFKRMSKAKKVGSKQDQKDYLKRDKMSDQELMDRVTNLRAKSNMKRTASDATKSQTDFAKNVITTAGPVVVSYALTGKVSKTEMAIAVGKATSSYMNKRSTNSVADTAAKVVVNSVKEKKARENSNK